MVRLQQTQNGMTYTQHGDDKTHTEPVLDMGSKDLWGVIAFAIIGTAFLAFLASPVFTRILAFFMGA